MRVIQLWRYPVKSMQGESLDAVDVAELGLAGDRTFALRDLTTGLTLTARREPSLLFASGHLVDGHAVVRMPDGVETDSDDVLSAWIGRDVALVAAADDTARVVYEIAADAEREADSDWRTWNGPRGAFHDSAKARVSIIGEDTLGEWPVRRFRPNVLVGGGDEGALVGATVRAGSTTLEVMKQIDRCVMITRPQPAGIERDLDVLLTVNRDRGTFVGVGALVRAAGRLAVGDQMARIS